MLGGGHFAAAIYKGSHHENLLAESISHLSKPGPSQGPTLHITKPSIPILLERSKEEVNPAGTISPEEGHILNRLVPR